MEDESHREVNSLRKRCGPNGLGFEYSIFRSGESTLMVMGTRWKRVGAARHSVRFRVFPRCIGAAERTRDFQSLDRGSTPRCTTLGPLVQRNARKLLKLETRVRSSHGSPLSCGEMASQLTVNQLLQVRVLPGQLWQLGRAGMRWSAKPLLAGSTPAVASTVDVA